jgi:purine-binding chemotaxis protein CheW
VPRGGINQSEIRPHQIELSTLSPVLALRSAAASESAMTELAAPPAASATRSDVPADGAARSYPSQLISFAIGDDQYGVDIMAVREIKGWTDITTLPRQPEYVRGVLNLRGIIVPIIDLRCRFGQGLTQATPLHIAIIVQIGGKPIGLLADRVLDIVSLGPSQIKPVPRVAQTQRLNFLSGLVTTEGAMIALIDLPNLLTVSVDGEAPVELKLPTAA